MGIIKSNRTVWKWNIQPSTKAWMRNYVNKYIDSITGDDMTINFPWVQRIFFSILNSSANNVSAILGERISQSPFCPAGTPRCFQPNCQDFGKTQTTKCWVRSVTRFTCYGKWRVHLDWAGLRDLSIFSFCYLTGYSDCMNYPQHLFTPARIHSL